MFRNSFIFSILASYLKPINMFRKTDKNKQLDMFSSPSQQLRGRSQRFYDKDNSWHNVFREQITLQIDEVILKLRYFTLKDVRSCALRGALQEIPPGERVKRNNVEASIFQLGYHYPHNKSRYRSLAKHRLSAYARWEWINFMRILKYQTQ